MIANILKPAQVFKMPEINVLYYIPSTIGGKVGTFNFMWPTQQIWDQMESKEETRIKTIEYTRGADPTSSFTKIQIVLSNGQKSPQFCAIDGPFNQYSYSMDVPRLL